MAISFIHYELRNGYIHNWLTGGPQTKRLSTLEGVNNPDNKRHIIENFYEIESGITKTPVERSLLTEGIFKVGDFEGTWAYYPCPEDHFVDHSGFFSTACYTRSWAYAQILCDFEQEVTFILTTYGLADVWLNNVHFHRQTHLNDQLPKSVAFTIKLQKKAHELIVRFEDIVEGNSPHAMAMQLCKPSLGLPADQEVYPCDSPIQGIRVRLPTKIKKLQSRNNLELIYNTAHLDRDSFERDDEIAVYWPDDLPIEAEAVARIQNPDGRIYGEAQLLVKSGERAFLALPQQLAEGNYHILLLPPPGLHYEGNMRISRELKVWAMGLNFPTVTPYGTYAERRVEALNSAAKQDSGLYSEIAKMALGQWAKVNTLTILRTIEQIEGQLHGSIIDLVGLLGMAYRFKDKPNYPESLREPMENCILSNQYEHDERSSDGRFEASECGRILHHTAAILAGQLYPERAFNHGAMKGLQLRQVGEERALEWLQEHGARGFKEWDSSSSYADDLIALSHLVDLAESEKIWDLATVVMDKLFLILALNSYKGVFGSTHGRATTYEIKGGLLEATAGITRLAWGMGNFNPHNAGTVSLACTEKYEFPTIIGKIANALPQEMWNRERHTWIVRQGTQKVEQEVNKVTYKTPDYMLCSAQDYRSGENGSQQHIWQATMAPAAVVFVTHPACSRQDESRTPNYWLGNDVMPRVAQWKDVLIAIHKLPEGDWMGFTHAYYPIYAFDEHILRGGWAFVRKGEGYLAITASQGLRLVREGQGAFREIRSYGKHNIWLCHMGRAALDGDFRSFQERILALRVHFDDLSVSCETLRGESLSFAWEGAFLHNGQEQPLSGFKHYENPYVTADLPATQMEIRWEDEVLRLDFGGQA